jgi:glutathione S-transferase
MIKLYYAPGACSLAAHIVLEELGTPYEIVRLDLTSGEQRKPEYLAINPKGRVPLLVTAQGTLTESAAILAYLADSKPEIGLLPADPWERAQALSFVAWCSGTVHGVAFASVFRAARFADDETAQVAVREKGQRDVRLNLAEIEKRLAGREWVMNHFGIADLYPLIFRRWAARLGVEMADFPELVAHAARVAKRPSVARVLATEGIRIDA